MNMDFQSIKMGINIKVIFFNGVYLFKSYRMEYTMVNGNMEYAKAKVDNW